MAREDQWSEASLNSWVSCFKGPAILSAVLLGMVTCSNGVLRTSIGLNILFLLYVGYEVASRYRVLDLLEELKAGEKEKTQKSSYTEENSPQNQSFSETTRKPRPLIHFKVRDVFDCRERDARPRTEQRGDYWVLYNYLPASLSFRCWESITYTTHADFTFLDNLETLLERWQGPISLALYAPGSDMGLTLDSIRYLYSCSSSPITEYVTFHIYFPREHIPEKVLPVDKLFNEYIDCYNESPWKTNLSNTTYKFQKKLIYPINVGRNIARESATTHYILSSDIELYPSPEIIQNFLKMVNELGRPTTFLNKNPKVFPLSIFEIESNMNLPVNKDELVSMLKNYSAIPFHQKVCPECHDVPKSEAWQKARTSEGLRVFHIAKRTGYFERWEPIFIGTHEDHLYDERLSWEGKRDKMTQGYILCALDYEFQILDNAFLVHKPGIKTLENYTAGELMADTETKSLIEKVIFLELKVLFGDREGCVI